MVLLPIYERLLVPVSHHSLAKRIFRYPKSWLCHGIQTSTSLSDSRPGLVHFHRPIPLKWPSILMVSSTVQQRRIKAGNGWSQVINAQN